MQIYTGFASVYDEFMGNIPYDEWVEMICQTLKEYGIENGIVCELGCGTGNITKRLSFKGYDMIGIDNSEEMLNIARDKEYEDFEYNGNETKLESERNKILYLHQDIREFELYGTVAAVVSLCDCLNYITKEEDLKKIFQLVNNYLDKDGIFIFDMKTVHFYRDILGNSTIAENDTDCSLIWENSYFEDTLTNQYEITIYKKCFFGIEDSIQHTNFYERIEEVHTQRAYELSTIIQLIEEAGMEFVTAYSLDKQEELRNNHEIAENNASYSYQSDQVRKSVSEMTERMYIVAREKQQSQKLYI